MKKWEALGGGTSGKGKGCDHHTSPFQPPRSAFDTITEFFFLHAAKHLCAPGWMGWASPPKRSKEVKPPCEIERKQNEVAKKKRHNTHSTV